MAKRRRNPQRSIEMVVDAPMQDCIHALERLASSGGKKRSQRVSLKVKTRTGDVIEFTLTLIRKSGESNIRTTLKGTMRFEPNYETTTVVGEIAPIHRRVFFMMTLLLGLTLLPFLLSTGLQVQDWVFVMLCIVSMPIYFWISYEDDQSDTQRLIDIATRELNGATYRHRQQALKSSMEDSPFYD